MKKGQVLEGTIEKVEFPNKGVVTVAEEGKSVIVKNGIPGQKVKFCVNKFKRGNAEGRLLEVLEKSPLETRKPVCSIFFGCLHSFLDNLHTDHLFCHRRQHLRDRPSSAEQIEHCHIVDISDIITNCTVKHFRPS